ncbi:MAG TPA: phosphoribosylformylglycinamidine synthase subunit PurS [Gemmatimonadota bacterium]
MTARAQVFIQLKDGMLDPQGKALEHALEALGYREVDDVRVGKWITFRIGGAGREDVERRVEEMCNRLLANTVIERFSFELEEIA